MLCSGNLNRYEINLAYLFSVIASPRCWPFQVPLPSVSAVSEVSDFQMPLFAALTRARFFNGDVIFFLIWLDNAVCFSLTSLTRLIAAAFRAMIRAHLRQRGIRCFASLGVRPLRIKIAYANRKSLQVTPRQPHSTHILFAMITPYRLGRWPL